MPGQEREARLRADVPGIHVLTSPDEDVDGRDKPGHDEKVNPFEAIGEPQKVQCLERRLSGNTDFDGSFVTAQDDGRDTSQDTDQDTTEIRGTGTAFALSKATGESR
jgi:hypothetical protein